jgi:hypothetical protein
MKNKISYIILIFLSMNGFNLNAQDADLLHFLSYEKNNIQSVNIYRWSPSKFPDKIEVDSILPNIEYFITDSIFENFICLYEQINYDTLGRIISKKYDYDYFVSRYRFMSIEKFSYPDEDTQCSIVDNSYTFGRHKEPTMSLLGDSTSYQYCANDGKLSSIYSYYKNHQKSITFKFIYRSIKNCSLIVVTYENGKIIYMDFYEFIYNDKKK